MKLVLNLFLFLFALFTFSDQSFSLTYYQMRKYCEKEKRIRQITCIKNLQEKKSILKKGSPIEIPVIPYSR